MKLGVIISSVLEVERFALIEGTEMVNASGTQVRVLRGLINGKTIAFINRSSVTNDAPHQVNYRANIEALKLQGVTHIITSSVSGSLNPEIKERDFVLLDQFLDFTKRSQFSRFSEGDFAFLDFTDPYSELLRSLFLNAAAELGISIHPKGCYVGVDGPRFETRAEVNMFRMLGGDVIGMTNVQETVMAREYGMHISSLAYISNMAAGLQEKFVTRIDNAASVNNSASLLQAIFGKVMSAFTGFTGEDAQALPEIEIIAHHRS